jgi:hypothetical protein
VDRDWRAWRGSDGQRVLEAGLGEIVVDLIAVGEGRDGETERERGRGQAGRDKAREDMVGTVQGTFSLEAAGTPRGRAKDRPYTIGSQPGCSIPFLQ